MVPTSIGIILLGPPDEAPGTAYEQRIGRFHIEIGGRTARRGSRSRLTGIPILNPEQQLSIGIICPLGPDTTLQGLGHFTLHCLPTDDVVSRTRCTRSVSCYSEFGRQQAEH